MSKVGHRSHSTEAWCCGGIRRKAQRGAHSSDTICCRPVRTEAPIRAREERNLRPVRTWCTVKLPVHTPVPWEGLQYFCTPNWEDTTIIARQFKKRGKYWKRYSTFPFFFWQLVLLYQFFDLSCIAKEVCYPSHVKCDLNFDCLLE